MNQVGIAALRAAEKILGGGAAVARAVGRKQPSVHAVLTAGKRVPAEWCIPLETATAEKGEMISRHQLRPDIYPMEDRQPVARLQRENRRKNQAGPDKRQAVRA